MSRWTIVQLRAALRLRELGLTYAAVAVVLNEYHGMNVSRQAVRSQLRYRGVAAANGHKGRLENLKQFQEGP